MVRKEEQAVVISTSNPMQAFIMCIWELASCTYIIHPDLQARQGTKSVCRLNQAHRPAPPASELVHAPNWPCALALHQLKPHT